MLGCALPLLFLKLSVTRLNAFTQGVIINWATAVLLALNHVIIAHHLLSVRPIVKILSPTFLAVLAFMK